MSDNSSEETPVKEQPVEVIYEHSIESSEDPPMAEWSSFILPEDRVNPKWELYKEGLYDPGSGEICGKYISMSCSSVLRHVYYNYPANKDPGIEAALLKPEPRKIYPLDGMELYLDLCKEMQSIPVMPFYRGLLKDEINLRYYSVNPANVRAMCLSLVNNKYVRRLDLTSNFLNMDACYHLGQLLGESFALTELILSGCKIGPPGLLRVVDQIQDRVMDELDISRNNLGDEGFRFLTEKIQDGAVVKKLNISRNDLTGFSAKMLADAIVDNNTITHLNLSWNKMGMTFSQAGPNLLLNTLGDSEELKELDFSWNGLTVTAPIRKFLSPNTLEVLILRDNRLPSQTIRTIGAVLPLCTKLHTLDISHNMLVPADAFFIMTKMRDQRIKLKNLYMDDEPVNKEFLPHYEQLTSLKYRSNLVLTFGRVMRNYTLSTKDLREIVMKRLAYVTRPTKKNKFDLQLFLLQLSKKKHNIEPRETLDKMKIAGAPAFGDALIVQCASHFPGPVTEKGVATINMDIMVDYVRRLWPDKVLPPSPPPEPKTPPPPEPKMGKKGDKGKKK